MSVRFAAAPPEVQAALRNCLLYNLSMALAVDVATDSLGKALGSVAQCPGPARLIHGRGTRSAADAAFVNAGLITSRGQNDTHPDVVTHIGCIVIPAVLALAEERAAPLSDVLDAILTGYEAIPRLAHGLANESGRRGFRATPVYGVLGAALAGARLMRLSGSQTAHALSIATHCAGGLMQTWLDGSQEWRLQVAKASRDAVTSVKLAQSGLRGSDHCLDGTAGVAAAFAGQPFAFDASGWKILDVAFKPYPGCAFNQAPVHALRLLIRQKGIDPRRIASVDVRMHPTDANYPGVNAYGPFSSPSGAIMSGPFMLAATLRDGLPRVAHFDKEFGASPFHENSRKVRILADPSVARWQCRLAVTLADGTVHDMRFEEPRPFVFDWARTVELCEQVSQEWPMPPDLRQARFSALVGAVQALASDEDWQALRGAIY